MSDIYGLNTAQGYDPNLLAQMQYILNMGGNPYMPMATPSTDIFGGGISAPEADEEYSIEDQNRQLTAFKSSLNILSDPAFIANYGTMFGGGFRPEDVAPRYTYEPIDQPGRRLVEQYASQGMDASLESYVASMIQQGASPTTIKNGLIAAYNQPENKYHEFARAMVPKTIAQPDRIGDPERWEEVVDPAELGRVVSGLYDQYIKDPLGPTDENGEPIVDPATGLPAKRTEEPNPIRDYFRKTGLPFPWEPYDRDAFVGQERKDVEENALAEFQRETENAPGSASNDIRRLSQQLLDEQTGIASDRQALAKFLGDKTAYDYQENALGRRLAGAQAAGQAPIGQRTVDVPLRGQVLYPEYVQGKPLSRAEIMAGVQRPGAQAAPPRSRAEIMGQAQGGDTAALYRRLLDMEEPTTTVTPEKIAAREGKIRSLDATIRKRKSEEIQARAGQKIVDQARRTRENQMNTLMQAGYSPYHDVTRARQQALMSMFLGK